MNNKRNHQAGPVTANPGLPVSVTVRVNRQSTLDYLKETSQRAEPLPIARHHCGHFLEYLGTTTPAEVNQMLFLLNDINPFANRVYATMEACAKAKSIRVGLDLEPELGKPFKFNRIVITIED